MGQSEQSFDYQKLIYTLSKEVKQGKKQALRDLGSLASRPELNPSVSEILKSISFFTPEEFDFSKSFKKSVFLKFYYDREEELRFSEILQAWYISPVEAQDVTYKIRQPQKEDGQDPSVLLRRLMKNLEITMEVGDDGRFLDLAIRIAELETKEGFEFLLEILKTNRMFRSPLSNPSQICRQLCRKLIAFPHKETVQTFLVLIKEDVISPEFASPLLAKMTNISVTRDARFEDLIPRYEFWLDSLKTTDEMRFFGYGQVINFKRSYFQYSVDYYGKILSSADDFPWIRHNALKDIVQTQNPRALFYIAALAWRHRKSGVTDKNFQFYAQLLEKLADLKVAIEGKQGLLSKHDWKYDEVASRNFVKYWASHYQDYEWDDIRKSFMNKEEAIALTQNYERLFRRLNSENDSVAMQSYLMLTEGDPIEVLGLARKYKELLRNYNSTLPSFKHDYLEQLVQLTDFCRRNGFRYKAPPRLNQLLQKLESATSQKDRYIIENQIISRLAPDEVTALEYWGCLHEGSSELSFSIGRILDWFYSRNWNRIMEDEEYLRLYLKKGFLFKNIGVEGICNVYLNKFEQYETDFRDRLRAILKIEGDEDIIFQIKELLAYLDGQTSESLSDFLNNPDFFMPADIKKLPTGDSIFIQKLISAIDSSDNKYRQKNYLLYLNESPSQEMAPKLFNWLNQKIQPYLVTKIIEKIFDHKLKGGPKAWMAFWAEDQANWENWAQSFFDEKLTKLDTAGTLSVKDINAVLQSPLFELKYKINCLEALKKISPVRDVRRLRIDGWLSVREDLVYFNRIKLGYKYLDDIIRFFDLKGDMVLMTDWLMEKSNNYELEERGSFFNNLFQKNQFFDFVNDGHIAGFVAEEIKITLQNYLSESDFISEFEEQTTIRNITLLENLGKSLEEKIINTLRLTVDENSKTSIEEAILARISFEDIPVVIKYFNDLSVLAQYNFLSKDFGLPVFDLQNAKVQNELTSHFKKKKPGQLYEHYLEKFGVDFKTTSGQYDFNKIYTILQYDIVMPFVGSGGTKRDFYTYGLIKLLEIHFQTRLGFHEKLNENQTFYTFTASKRARAWLDYLVENHHVMKPENQIPSFNAMVRD